MKRWIPLVILWLAGPASAAVVDSVAAVVDGRVLTRTEVEEVMALGERMGQRTDSNAFEQALEVLIEKTLVGREAERLGIQVSEEEVEQAVAEIRGRNGLSPQAFRSALASQGVSYDAYLEEIRYQIQRMKVAGQVLRSRLRVGEEALREYYLKNVAKYRKPGMVRLCHIQLPAEVGREEAEAVRQRVLDGEDMTQLAREVSRGPTAEQGGDMGLVALENLSEQVRRAIATLPEGGVSPVVEMGGACHIFAIIDRTDGEIPTFEEVRDEIQDLYYRDKEEELYRTWIESLKEKARIERKM